MEVENSPSLEAEFSLLEEEFFGERLEEKEADNSDTAGSDSDSVEGTELNIGMESCDVEELQAIQRFVDFTCGCSKKQGTPCSGYFDQKEYEDTRMSMAELENDQLDLVILSQINAHHFSGRLAGHRTETEKSLRVKEYTNFLYKSHTICLKTFLFLHGIGKKRFCNLMKHYQLNGVTV